MINNEIKVEKKESQDYTPLPDNIYQVELLDITDEQRPTYDTRNNPDETKKYETVLNFQFTLLDGKDGEEELRGRSLWANFVPTYLYEGKKGKNKLYQITEALLERKLTQEDEATMDGTSLNKMVGRQCRVGTKNKTSGDKIYTNIDVYYPADVKGSPLTAEEKESATVKVDGDKDKKSLEAKNEPSKGTSEEINPEDIPFN